MPPGTGRAAGGRHAPRPRRARPARRRRPRRLAAAAATSTSRPPTRQAPRFAERGLPGEEGWIELQLKLLADVGLVGLPNAGKSSLLSRLTRAAPKIADYPFTTLEPVLGTIDADDRQLVLADIPGLIEGASEGAGLGHDFLAHVERTRLLVHVLDLAPLDGSDPAENHATIERELAAHDPRLAALPRILALSKADLVPPEEAREAARGVARAAGRGVPVLVTSSATRRGARRAAPARCCERVPARAAGRGRREVEGLAEHQVFRPGGAARLPSRARGGRPLPRRRRGDRPAVLRYDVENEEAMAHLERRLKRIGVIEALEHAGFEPGDDVEIGGVVFELDPS